MTPELKRLHSPDVDDLTHFSPATGEPFGILVQAMFGPVGVDGEESFDVVVCTPGWLEKKVIENSLYSGRHHLICSKFDLGQLIAFFEDYAREAEGENWQEVAEKLSRIAQWEFEDYVTHLDQ